MKYLTKVVFITVLASYTFLFSGKLLAEEGFLYLPIRQAKVTCDFCGYIGEYGCHAGIDYDTDDNSTEIYAAADGLVINLNKDINITSCKKEPYGNYVKILHENGYSTIYAHLLPGSVKINGNDEVKAGELIGIGDTTGCAYGSHLHFEVRDPHGLKVDPYGNREDISGQEISPKLIQRFRRRLETEIKEIESKKMSEIRPLMRKKERLATQLVNLADMLAQGRIDMAVYDKLKNKYSEEKAIAEERIEYLEKSNTSFALDSFDMHAAVTQNLQKMHNKFNYDQRKKLLYALFKKIIVRNKEIVSIEFNPPFDTLFIAKFDNQFKKGNGNKKKTNMERGSPCQSNGRMLKFGLVDLFKEITITPTIKKRDTVVPLFILNKFRHILDCEAGQKTCK